MSLLRKTNIGQELYDKAVNEVSYQLGGTSERPYIKNNILYVKLTEPKLYTSYQLEESILKLGINKVKILNNHVNINSLESWRNKVTFIGNHVELFGSYNLTLKAKFITVYYELIKSDITSTHALTWIRKTSTDEIKNTKIKCKLFEYMVNSLDYTVQLTEIFHKDKPDIHKIFDIQPMECPMKIATYGNTQKILVWKGELEQGWKAPEEREYNCANGYKMCRIY